MWNVLSLYTQAVVLDKLRIQDVVVSVYRRFNDNDYVCLDTLLSWVQKIVCLARVLRETLCSPSTPLNKPVDTSFEHSLPLGHRQLILAVSSTLLGLKVYMIPICGQTYICGLEGIPSTKCGLIGERRRTSHTIYFRPDNIEDLGLVVDSLGLLSLRIGQSEWSSKTPHELNSFEGLDAANIGVKEIVVSADVGSRLALLLYILFLSLLGP
jgi:hypothetical protein